MYTKHTPGPWITERCDNGMEILDMEQESVAGACNFGNPYNAGETEANARLIAAAPDLLAAMKGVMQEIDNCVADGSLSGPAVATNANCKAARAAIAKATHP